MSAMVESRPSRGGLPNDGLAPTADLREWGSIVVDSSPDAGEKITQPFPAKPWVTDPIPIALDAARRISISCANCNARNRLGEWEDRFAVEHHRRCTICRPPPCP